MIKMRSLWLIGVALLLPVAALAQLSEGAATASNRTIRVPTESVSLKCANVVNSTETRPLQLHRMLADTFSETTLNPQLWHTFMGDDPTTLGGRTISSNNEKEIYVDPAFAGSSGKRLGLNPFHFKNGILTITIQKTPSELLDKLHDLPFTSGLIITARPFRYGYFEINARLSRGNAVWPAFWLMPVNQWPPEIDILEALKGEDPEIISFTTHWGQYDPEHHKYSLCNVNVPDSTTKFHAYGMYWSPDRIVYYLDQKPVVQMATPPGVNIPMRLEANLGVQSNADDSTTGHTFEIDWISIYQESEQQ